MTWGLLLRRPLRLPLHPHPRLRLRSHPSTWVALALVAAFLAAVFSAMPGPPGGMSAAPRATQWAELIPADWDPLKRFRRGNLDSVDDSNPQAMQLLQDMRAAWDNAPTNSSLDGTTVTLAGYVVPLSMASDQVSEFLLVPYFGACVHAPPPPANQIVHVLSAKPLDGLHVMSAVWVSGRLSTQRVASAMGMSGYRMQQATVLPYTLPSPPESLHPVRSSATPP